MLLIGDILRRHAAVRGEQTAYVVGTERVTYRQFHERSNRLARALRSHDVGRGDRVAVLANNCLDYPVLYFGVVKLGAIVVPINARFQPAEIEWTVGHAEAATLFYADSFATTVDEMRAAGRLPSLTRFIGLGLQSTSADADLDRFIGDACEDDVDAEIDETAPFVLLYTSGTTGSAKGALLSHRAYCLQAPTSHVSSGIREEDIALSMFPMFHMGGWSLPFSFWHTGGTVVIMPKADPSAILAAIEREKVSYLYAVPTVFQSMLALEDFERFDLSSLRTIASGTSAMTAAQVHEIRQRFGCDNMYIMYGSTEAGPVSTLRPRDISRRPESVGRPFLNVEIRLRDEHGGVTAVGEPGEITVRSEFTMLGYWRNPEETARTIRDGCVRTGDLAVFDEEGFLSIVGRCKEVIRSGGESIFPMEVERVLLLHEAIQDAAVIGVPDAVWGEAVAAVVVLKPGAELTAEAVIEHVRANLASYKKPKSVHFVSELPRTVSSRQVHKTLLREQILAGRVQT